MVSVRILAIASLIIILVALGLVYVLTRSITITNVTYTETPRALAVYMTIRNEKFEEVCLVKVELGEPGDVMVELHETVVREGGIHEMRPVEKLCLGPRSSLELKPGGYHIMVMGSTETLGSITADKIVKLRLIFDDGTVVDVEAKPLESMPQTEHHSSSHH